MARKNNIDVVVKGDYQDKDINRAIGDLKKLQASSMSLGGKMKALGGQVQSFGNNMAKTGKSLTAGVTLPIVGVGVAAVATAAEFEKSMNRVAAVSGATGADFEALKDQAAELGRTTSFTAGQAAEGMSFLAMAGFKTVDILASMPGVLQLAAAGQMDLATAADIASNVLTGYNKTADEMTGVVDVLAKTFTSANTDLVQLGEAMKYAAPTAAGAGVQFEEAAAAIGLMGNAGIQGSMAGTSLRNSIGALLDPSAKASKALKNLGITTTDSQGNLLSFESIVRQLGDSGATTSDFLTIFGKRAGPAMQALVSQGADALADLTGELENSGGTAQSIADTQLEGLQGQLTKLKSAFEGLMISIAESGLLDRATSLMQSLTDGVARLTEKFESLSPRTQNMIFIFAGIAAAIGPILIVVGKLISSVGSLITVLGGITVAGSILAIKIIAVVAAVAAVAVAFKMMWDRSEALRSAVGTLIGTVQNIARVLVGDLVRAFQGVIGQGTSARNILDTIARVAGNVLAAAIQVLVRWWNILANGIRITIQVFEVVGRIITMTANLIRGLFVAAIDILFNKLGPVSAALRDLATGVRSAFSTAVSAVQGAFNNIGKGIEGFINFAIRAVNNLIDAYNKLADVLPGVTRATHVAAFEFKNLTSSGVQAASSANNLANSVGGYASQVMRGNQATEAGVTSFGNLGAAADAAVPGLDTFSEAMAGPGGGGGGGAAGATDKATSKMDRFKAKFDEVAARLKSAREEIEAQYVGMAKTVQDAVLGALDFSDALPEVDEQGNQVGGTFMDRLNEQANRAIEFAAKIRTLIQQGLSPEAITMVVQEGVNAGTKIADELINGGATAIDETNRLVESTQGAAKEIGDYAAETYYGTGLALAKKTEDGFTARFGPGGPGYGKLNRMMSALAKSMERETVITIVTRHVTEGTPGGAPAQGWQPRVQRANGGPLFRGIPTLVGERGPEVIIPQVSGTVVRGEQTRQMLRNGGGNVYLTVNAGMGTDGPEVGRQIVDALKAYERRNGAVYASA